MTARGYVGTPHLRVGDEERERAVAELGEHVAAGRLDATEHAERIDAAWTARTRGDLDILFDDLPAHPAAGPVAAYQGAATRRGPRILLPLLALLVVASILTHLPLLLIGLGALGFVLIRRGRRHSYDAGCRFSASPG